MSKARGDARTATEKLTSELKRYIKKAEHDAEVRTVDRRPTVSKTGRSEWPVPMLHTACVPAQEEAVLVAGDERCFEAGSFVVALCVGGR